jgi:hypothetical protein
MLAGGWRRSCRSICTAFVKPENRAEKLDNTYENTMQDQLTGEF